jgi:hypothetical protein
MNMPGRNPNFRAKPKFAAITELRGRIPQPDGARNPRQKILCHRRIFGDNRIRMLAAKRRAASSARKSHPSAAKSATISGNKAGAMAASSKSVSVAPQTPVRRIFAFASTARAIAKSAPAWT